MTKVSAHLIEVGRRLEQVVKRYESRTEAARVAGISTDQLARYLAGDSPRLGFAPIARLCVDQGVSLEWVWMGGAQSQAPVPQVAEAGVDYEAVDWATLQRIMAMVEDHLETSQQRLPVPKRILLYKLAYQEARRNGNIEDRRLSDLIQLALEPKA